MSELDQLIAEQEHDRRYGDRSWSVSLDAPLGPDSDMSLLDLMTDGDLEVAARKVLKPRREQAVKRVPNLIGYQQRERLRRRKYGAVCECGAITDGSNGRTKAPRLCRKCFDEARNTTPHGSATRYKRGCRCQECRWANARRVWDARQRKLERVRPSAARGGS